MFAFVFLASCGGGGGSGGSTSADSVNHDEPNSAAITFELQIQPGDVDERNASLGRLAAEADICRDYSIDAFEVVVTWGGDLENERLVTWPCNDHSGMIDKLPTDVPLNLSINGIVDGQIQWHAEFNNLVLNPGETRSLGYITLGYVGNDRQGPQMVATVPPANAQGVDPSAAVSIQLDEPLAVSSIMDDALRLSADGADVSGTVEYDPGSRTIRFIPDQVLLPEKLYNAVLDAAITDIAGNAMESDYTWSFTTQAYGIHISKTGSGNGTVTSDPAGIDCGSQCSTDFSGISTVTLTAVPADDSTFIGWSGGGCTGTGSCTTTITGPIAVSAEFAIKTYTITATAGSGGAISPSGAVTVDHGASQRFTITANTGYYLSSLLVDNVIVPTQFTYTFSNVTSDRAIAAIFSPIPEDALSVSKTGSGNGTVTSDPAGINCGSQCMAQFTEGTAVTLTAAAAADSTFTGWSGGGCSGTGSCTTTINDPVAVSAEFAIKTYTITATAGSGGTISPSGAVTVNHGADRTFTISANAGYYLSRLRVDGANVTAASTYTFSNVTGNHTIEAVFAIRTYTITATAGTGGTISPSGTVTVNHGANRTFTISANAGYYLSRLRVDGANVTAASTYTFSNVTGNHTIEAVFAIRTCTITAWASIGGTISPQGSVSVNHGAGQNFAIVPETGFYLSELYIDDLSVTPISTYSFSNVTSNHSIAAYFAYKTYGLNFSPYMDGQDPTMGSQISEQQLRTRMEIIEPHTVWIRTFGSSSGLEKSGAIAHDLGLKAALGAWIGSDSAANEHEIGNLIAAAQAGEADLLIVGSEVLLRGDLSENELIYYIDRVKQEVPGLPVGYADSCGVWLSHPNIINAVDIVLVNYYPYWEGIRIDWAVTAVNDWHTQVTAAANGKPVIVGGTGWPSYGDQIGNAIPSPDNASFYFLDFVSWAHANDVDYFYFEAFDESWKAAYEGPQGAHWGIWDKDGMLKSEMERVFNGEFLESN